MANGETEARDGWAKAEIAGGLLLPVVIAVGGLLFDMSENRRAALDRQAESRNAQAREQADRLTSLLEHLGSENPRQRLLALKVTEEFGKRQQLPPEILPAVREVATSDPVSEVAGTASQVLAEATIVAPPNSGQSSAPHTMSGRASVEAIPPRVYIHIVSESQHAQAQRIAGVLERAGFLVPGIERVTRVPASSELRTFEGASDADVDLLRQQLKEVAPGVRIEDFAKRFKGAKIRPRHYELWLAPPRP